MIDFDPDDTATPYPWPVVVIASPHRDDPSAIGHVSNGRRALRYWLKGRSLGWIGWQIGVSKSAVQWMLEKEMRCAS